MEFDLVAFQGIEKDAFNAVAFKSVKSLSLVGIHMTELKTGIFNGLESLEVLNIRHSRVLKSVDNGILDVLNRTLKELTFERSGDLSSIEKLLRLQVESFTGSDEPLNHLEYVIIRYYIYTFVGLKNIKYLDLSHCDISIVQRGAFDPISSTLKVLRMESTRKFSTWHIRQHTSSI